MREIGRFLPGGAAAGQELAGLNGGTWRAAPVFDARDYGTLTLGASPSSAQRTANTSAVQAAIDAAEAANGGVVRLPAWGEIAVSALTVDNPSITIEGLGRDATLLTTNSGDLITLGPSGTGKAYYFTCRDLTLRSRTGGGHVFACTTNISGGHWQRLSCIQENAAKSVYSHSGQDYIDNRWEHCFIQISNSASVAMFSIRSNACTRNLWSDLRTQGAGYYHFDLETNAVGGYVNDGVIEHITAEFPNGGFARLAGARMCRIADVGVYDLPTIGATTRDLIVLADSATGLSCNSIEISKVGRHGGSLGTGLYDISVSGAACDEILYNTVGNGQSGAAVNAGFKRGFAINCGNVAWTNAGVVDKVGGKFGLQGVAAQQGVFSIGYQATATARTATSDGAGTGLIADNTRVVTVTSANDAFFITLPTPTPGVEVTITNGATGYNLRASAPATVAINGGTGASASSAIAATTTVHCRCVSASRWLCTSYAADGTASATAAAT